MAAFALALSSAIPASATAFTIPAGSTTSCKKNASPVKDWWPNSGNSNNVANSSVLSMAVLNGQIWVVNRANSTTNMSMAVIDGESFKKVSAVDMTGIPTSGDDIASGNVVQIRRFGDKIIGLNCPSSFYKNSYFYIWEKATSKPTITKFCIATVFNSGSDGRVSLGRGLGVYGTPTDGKIYVLSQNKKKVLVFTIKNNTINTKASVITLSGTTLETTDSDYAYIEPMSDGSFWIATQKIYGYHYKSDGSFIEKLESNGIGTSPGTGQRHFTFKDQKLALCMNFSSGKDASELTSSWVKPHLSLIDYTNGVGSKQNNIIEETTILSDHVQDKIIVTACDYEIKTADKHLILYGLDCDGGIVRVEYDETSKKPAIVANFKAEAKWDGAEQKVTLSWDAAAKATSYSVLYYTDDEKKAVEVYNDSKTTCTLDLAIGGGKKHHYKVKGVNADGESEKSSYASTYDAGFGNIVLLASMDPQDATSTAKLEWNAPTGGTLKDYTLVKVIEKTPAGGTATTTKEDFKTIPAGTTKYDIPNFSSQTSVTENGVKYSVTTSLYIRANMAQTVTTKDYEKTNTAVSNTVTPSAAGAPYFTNVTTYKGRRTVALSWAVQSPTNLKYYELYRDGIRILNNTDAGSYIDTDLPDGTYTYQIIAYWEQNGNKYVTRSTTVSASIKYESDVSTYILDTIYDYPIMTNDEWVAAGQPADACVATNNFANAKMPVGSGGAPGDAFRQGWFYNGKWYLAKLTACDQYLTYESKTYIPGGYWALSSDKWKSDWSGGAYVISADDATIKTIGNANALQQVLRWNGLENQYIAMDEQGILVRRASNNDLSTEGNYYRPTRYLQSYDAINKVGVGVTDIIKYNGKTFVDVETDYFNTTEGKKRIEDYNKANPKNQIKKGTTFQYYRTHYISVGGNIKGGTGYALLAMNHSADLYKVLLNTNGTMKSIKKFTAPYSGMKDSKGNAVDPWNSTENYAFPVAGRNGAFIHAVRGIGKWYVDANGKYTLMYSDNADVTQSPGATFTYNNELFVLRPSSIRSNSPGNFVIDMVQRKDGETAATVVPSKDNLVPTVANKLDEIAGFTAGNSNASWYGTEYSAADECIYIYQYVPGVRFAKYRLYIREQYPDVPPTLDITTGYNEDKTDITRFDSKITWQRPGTNHDYGLSENADITVDHYEVALKDKAGNVLQAWNDVKDVNDASHVFTLEYNKTASGEYNLDSEKYTVEIVPIYKRKSGTIIRGASNFAVDDNDYPAAIGEVNAYIYNGTGSAAGMYRVDLDFDRALTDQSPEPVSYFLVEVSTDGGTTYSTLSNFNLLKQGEDYHYYPVAVTNGQVPGQYKFGTTNVGDSPSEKGYALREHANHATDHLCVLYYYSNVDPSNFKYRVTAVYASTNARIRKTASNNAENIIGGTSGIGDATGYSLSAYPVPATTEVTVTSPEAIRDIRIFSASGAEVIRVAGEDGYTQSVDVSTLAPGMYMLVVNEQTPIRIVKK
mgnify:CR=1 FL=1